MTKILELSEKPHLIPYLDTIPAFIKALEPYREATFAQALNTKTLLNILQYCIDTPTIKDALSKTGFKPTLDKLAKLDRHFLSTLSTLSFKEIIDLIKICAHPNFSCFLETLPAQTTVGELTQWLHTEPNEAPVHVQESLTALHNYQNNHERIAHEATQAFKKLTTTFNLTAQRLKDELPKPFDLPTLAKPPADPTPVAEPVIIPKATTTPWASYANISASLTLLALCNLYFLSLYILVTSMMLIYWLSRPYINDYFSSDLPRPLTIIPAPESIVPVIPVALSVTTTLTQTQQPTAPTYTENQDHSKHKFFAPAPITIPQYPAAVPTNCDFYPKL